jgi:hypothetical protein
MGAFGGTSLTNVTIPNSVTSFGFGAFGRCTSLTSAIIGNGVPDIADSAFFGCTSLTNITIPASVTSLGVGAFSGCSNLTIVTIPNSVTNIGHYAFADCTNLTGLYFRGNAPAVDSTLFQDDVAVTAFYLPGKSGWGTNFAGLPTAVWLPQIQTSNASFGVKTNQFGFNITWADGLSVVVEASPSLRRPVWSPVATNTLSGGWFYFTDPQWANRPSRFYRVRSQ